MTSPDSRLTTALNRKKQTEQRLAHQDARIRELMLQDALKGHSEYAALTVTKDKLKAQRHRCRLTVGRKRFAVRCRLNQIKEIRRSMRACQEADRDLTKQIEDIEGRQARIREGLGRAVRADQCSGAASKRPPRLEGQHRALPPQPDGPGRQDGQGGRP